MREIVENTYIFADYELYLNVISKKYYVNFVKL